MISLAVAVLIGVVGLGMTAAGEFDLLEGSASETIIVQIADLLSKHGVIAAILAGLILAGILASTMSTADSQLLAASSAVSSDLLGSILKDKETKKESMVADKITLLLIAVVAMFIARDPNSSVFTIVSFAWAGFGAVFGPVVLLALFWRRSNWQGALAGMICGGSMYLSGNTESARSAAPGESMNFFPHSWWLLQQTSSSASLPRHHPKRSPTNSTW